MHDEGIASEVGPRHVTATRVPFPAQLSLDVSEICFEANAYCFQISIHVESLSA